MSGHFREQLQGFGLGSWMFKFQSSRSFIYSASIRTAHHIHHITSIDFFPSPSPSPFLHANDELPEKARLAASLSRILPVPELKVRLHRCVRRYCRRWPPTGTILAAGLAGGFDPPLSVLGHLSSDHSCTKRI